VQGKIFFALTSKLIHYMIFGTKSCFVWELALTPSKDSKLHFAQKGIFS